MSRILVGLTARPKAGKGSFCKIIQDLLEEEGYNLPPYKNSFFNFSAPLREALERAGIPVNRDNMQRLAQEWETGKEGALTQEIKNRVDKAFDSGGGHDLVIVDGVRWFTDEDMVRNYCCDVNIIVYIKANPEVRYERMRLQAENAGDDIKTWAQFLEEDDAKNEKFIPIIGQNAGYTIENNATEERFRSWVKHFYRSRIAIHF
ncbi:MAG: AAA family ATPase [Patescibacteria group bacterium]